MTRPPATVRPSHPGGRHAFRRGLIIHPLVTAQFMVKGYGFSGWKFWNSGCRRSLHSAIPGPDRRADRTRAGRIPRLKDLYPYTCIRIISLYASISLLRVSIMNLKLTSALDIAIITS